MSGTAAGVRIASHLLAAPAMTNHSFLRDSSQFTPLDRGPGMAHARKKVPAMYIGRR
jgi:hypothetical protein